MKASHPARVRGLKRHTFATRKIKTLSHPARVRGLKHKNVYISLNNFVSHPARVRGLKRGCCSMLGRGVGVAPRAGAWIETPGNTSGTAKHYKSHPARVRGLKPKIIAYFPRQQASHPARVRGLKLELYTRDKLTMRGRTPRGCVD